MAEKSHSASKLSEIVPPESKDEFIIIERVFSDDDGNISIGRVNIHAIFEANKNKMALFENEGYCYVLSF